MIENVHEDRVSRTRGVYGRKGNRPGHTIYNTHVYTVCLISHCCSLNSCMSVETGSLSTNKIIIACWISNWFTSCLVHYKHHTCRPICYSECRSPTLLIAFVVKAIFHILILILCHTHTHKCVVHEGVREFVPALKRVKHCGKNKLVSVESLM